MQVEIDDLIQDLLVLPPGTDLHKHPLVLNGCLVLQVNTSCAHLLYTCSFSFCIPYTILYFAPSTSVTRFAFNLSIEMWKFMTLFFNKKFNLFIGQGKASCMPAQALAPDCDWEVYFKGFFVLVLS